MSLLAFAKRLRFSEHFFVLVILLAAGIFGFYYQQKMDMPSAVGYPLHIPAMIAAGHGFVEPVTSGDLTEIPGAPELGRFLREERETLPLSEIPHDLETRKPGYFWVYYHQHMYYTIGWLWRIFGISWEAVRALRVLMLCMMAVSIYGIFRLGIGRLWSFGATLFLLWYLMPFSVQIRDFSPGAFILPIIFLLGYLLTHPVRTRRFLFVAACLGLLIGVGIGFRTNVIVCLLPVALVLGTSARPAFRGRLWWRWTRKALERGIAMALVLAIFAALGWPVLKAYREDRISAHDFAKGLATVYDDNAGVGRASYERVYKNNDAYVGKVWETHAVRAQEVTAPLQPVNEQREVYMRDVLETFPGDMLTRAYVSILWVLRGGMILPPQENIDQWKIIAGAITGLSLMLIAARNLRLAVVTLMLLMYFCGYLSLQAAVRHGFHLAFVPLWVVGFLLDNRSFPCHRLLTSPKSLKVDWARFRDLPRFRYRAMGMRMASFLLIAAVIIAAPLYAARAVQDEQLEAILTEHSEALLEPVAVQPVREEGWVLFQRVVIDPPHAGSRLPYRDYYHGDYYVVLLDARASADRLFIRYESVRDIDNYSQGVWLPPASGGESDVVRHFVPVYERAKFWLSEWSYFDGVALPAEDADAFRGLYRVRNVRAFSFLLSLTLPPKEAPFWPHQTVFGQRPPLPEYHTYAETQGQWIPHDNALRVPKLSQLPGLASPAAEVERYEGAIVADPSDPEHWLGLAAALDAGGEDSRSLESYRKALSLNPRLYVTYEYLEDFFRRRGDGEGRVAQWRTMSFFHPDLWLPRLYLGRALADQARHPEATAAFTDALRRNPCYIPAWYDLLDSLPWGGGIPNSVGNLIPRLRACEDPDAEVVLNQLERRQAAVATTY